MFIEDFLDCCTFELEYFNIELEDIYEKYKSWCTQCGFDFCSKNMFKKTIFVKYKTINRYGNVCILNLNLKQFEDWEFIDYINDIKLYIISDGTYKKIGITKNPEKRIIELQTGNPNKLKFIRIVPALRKDEKYFHKKYKHKKVNGEWFDLNDQDILEITKG